MRGSTRPSTKKQVRMDGCERKRSIVQWDKASRLQVIAAVIEVEEELLMAKVEGAAAHGSIGTGGSTKWDEIANRLPVKLRGRNKNLPKNGVFYKCARLFGTLRYIYKAMTLPDRKQKLGGRRDLTAPEFEMMKKHDDILRRQVSVRGRVSPALRQSNKRKQELRTEGKFHEKQESDMTTSSFLEGSSEGYSIGSETNQEAQETNESESLEGSKIVPKFHSNLGNGDHLDHIDHETSMDRRTSAQVPQDSVRNASRQLSESNDGVDVKGEHAGRTAGVETRSETRAKSRDYINSATSQPVRQSRPSSGKGQDRSLLSPSADAEDLLTIEGQIDLEFSNLSSWLLSRAIPVGKRKTLEDVKDFSAKKRKEGNGKRPPTRVVSQPFDELIRESSNTMTRQEIHALFYKLRIRFAKELENTSMEIIKRVVEVVHPSEEVVNSE